MAERRQNRSGTFRRKRLAHWLRDYVIVFLIPIVLKSGYDLLCFVFWKSTLSFTSMIIFPLPSVIVLICAKAIYDLVDLDVKRAIRKANSGTLRLVASVTMIFVIIGSLLQMAVWIAYQNASSLNRELIYAVLLLVFGALLLTFIAQLFMGGLEYKSAPAKVSQGGNSV